MDAAYATPVTPHPHAPTVEQLATWVLPLDPAVVAAVRAGVSRQLCAWGLEEAVFTTELLVSELVTNAICHGAAPITLRLVRGRVLICEVSDGGCGSPRPRRVRGCDEGGRGLFLVAQLCQSWGVRHTSTGKTVWTEQPLP
ncbi:ATP-binding region ATPase domain protein [Candidatus Protofrankia datiscae]|uniref:ATP-binding region ATPase domain protein n=2 Tax=Protofrankia TaxID=2994361 RepID=F8B459_9ACTN|nr:ATP-binding protein [Candidatus Protofrankia datiscae]AEH10967.1 ATP-binding region ATPase domain protein [Candidatus Protofrankia datiscae]